MDALVFPTITEIAFVRIKHNFLLHPSIHPTSPKGYAGHSRLCQGFDGQAGMSGQIETRSSYNSLELVEYGELIK